MKMDPHKKIYLRHHKNPAKKLTKVNEMSAKCGTGNFGNLKVAPACELFAQCVIP